MKNKSIIAAAICVLIPALLNAQPSERKQLAGLWEVKVVPFGHLELPLLSLALFNSDGSFTTSVGYKALPSIRTVNEIGSELGAGYGHWVVTSNREFRLTFYSVLWKAGIVNGYQRVQDTLVLSDKGDEFIGHARVDFLDAGWNVVFSTTSDAKGIRLETPVPTTFVARSGEIRQISGVWEDKLSPTGQWGLPLPLLSLALYGEDGEFITAGGYKALPPVVAVRDLSNEIGPGFGRWIATDPSEFKLTIYSVLWKNGLVNGFQRVHEHVVFSDSSDEYTGHSDIDFFDANWNVVFSTTCEVKGTKLNTSIPAMAGAQLPKRTGVWELKAQPVGGAVPPIFGLLLYCGDGSFVQTINSTLPPMPALEGVASEMGLGFGRWATTGPGASGVIFYAVLWKAGLVNGFQRLQATEVFLESGDEVTGRAQVEFFDRNWNDALQVTSDSKIKRLESPDQD
jgi:hypothetical protein